MGTLICSVEPLLARPECLPHPVKHPREDGLRRNGLCNGTILLRTHSMQQVTRRRKNGQCLPGPPSFCLPYLQGGRRQPGTTKLVSKTMQRAGHPAPPGVLPDIRGLLLPRPPVERLVGEWKELPVLTALLQTLCSVPSSAPLRLADLGQRPGCSCSLCVRLQAR